MLQYPNKSKQVPLHDLFHEISHGLERILEESPLCHECLELFVFDEINKNPFSQALVFFSLQSLESLTERCESALSLLDEALQSMEAQPMPDNIKVF